jgi:hypothetical protein
MPNHAQTFRSRPETCQHRYYASEVEVNRAGPKSWFPGLRRLREFGISYYRNSYRYRKCHIYETVKLNQIELSSITVKAKKDLKLSLSMV